MIFTQSFAIFAVAALLMALTPGPNMIYLISRSLCQGRAAGVVSWFGVVLGFTVHMFCAAIGSTVNLLVTLSAAAIAGWFARNRLWLAAQRYVMGLVLGALAVKLPSQQRSTV